MLEEIQERLTGIIASTEALRAEIDAIKQDMTRLGKAQSRMSTTLDAQNEIWEDALKEVSAAQARYEDAIDRMRESLRAQAETEALAVALKEFLPFLDNLREALRLMSEVSKNEPILRDWAVGLDGILTQGDRTLEALGIRRIETVGHKFDPHLHRAVEAVPVQEASLTDIVVFEVTPGYIHNGKVIRYADVAVGKIERGAIRREPYYRDRPWDDQFGCGDAGGEKAEGAIGGRGEAHPLGGGDLSGRKAPSGNPGPQPVYPLS